MSDPLATVLTTLLILAVVAALGWEARAWFEDHRDRRRRREQREQQRRMDERVAGTLADHERLRRRREHTLRDLDQWMEER